MDMDDERVRSISTVLCFLRLGLFFFLGSVYADAARKFEKLIKAQMTKIDPMNPAASLPKKLIALLQLMMVLGTVLLGATACHAQAVPTMNLVIKIEAPLTFSIGAPIKGKVYLHRSDRQGDLTSHAAGGAALQIKVDLLEEGKTIVLDTKDVDAGVEFSFATAGRPAGNYTVRATDKDKSPVTAATSDVKLAPTPAVSIFTVTFSNGPDVRQDTTTQVPFPSPQYQAGNTASPFSYQASATGHVTVSATLSLNPATASQAIRIKGEGGGYTFPEATCLPSVGKVSYPQTNSTEFLSTTIQKLDALTINWKYFRDSDQTWVSAGSSSNKIYITLSGSSDLNTVLDIATRGTGGLNATNNPSIFTGIWNQFAGTTGTTRVDGTPMKYWGRS